jgi:hypothetical protein
MSAGLGQAKSDFDRTIGNAVVSLAQALDMCVGINTMLNDAQRGGGSAGLQANQTYSSTESGLIIASFTDLAALAGIAHAQGTQAVANDFFFHARQLMGTIPL